jgi:hypothetical protein
MRHLVGTLAPYSLLAGEQEYDLSIAPMSLN